MHNIPINVLCTKRTDLSAPHRPECSQKDWQLQTCSLCLGNDLLYISISGHVERRFCLLREFYAADEIVSVCVDYGNYKAVDITHCFRRSPDGNLIDQLLDIGLRNSVYPDPSYSGQVTVYVCGVFLDGPRRTYCSTAGNVFACGISEC